MTQQSNQPQQGQPRELNLQQMAEQFIFGLQRHFDMLAFNLASREAVTEEAYNKHSAAAKLMPATQAHQNFEQMQAYSRDLLTVQVINDSVNMAVSCLNNVHLFLALVKANKDFGQLAQEAQARVQQSQQAFLQAPLDQKFNRLEEEYTVLCPQEDTITSLAMAMQVLVQQGGLVREPQLAEDGQLTIELQRPKAEAEPGDLRRQLNDLESFQKIFKEGEKVQFVTAELQHVLTTVSVFVHQLFVSVSNYARDNAPKA